MAGMRISGLASGMDIDQIVTDLMRAERIPLDKTKQKKQTLEWKRDAYRELNTLLSKFRDETLNMRLQSTFLSKITTSSNADKLTATANSRAGNVSYQIANATLATAAFNSSKFVDTNGDGVIDNAEKVSSSGKLDTTKKLWDLKSDFNNSFTWETKLRDTVHVFEEGTRFQLSRGSIKEDSIESGSVIGAGTTNQIKVTAPDGSTKNYDVVYDATVELTADQVYVNKDNGYMTFGEKLKKDSRIEANYNSYKNDTISVSSSNQGTVFKLSTPGLNTSGTMFDIKDNKAVIKTTKTVNGKAVVEEKTFTQVKDATEFVAGQNQFFVDKEGNLTFNNPIPKDSTISISYTHEVVNTAITTYNADGKEMKQSFAFDGSEKLNDFFSRINTSKIGVNVFYDEYTDTLSISRKETGNFNVNGAEMQFEGDFLTSAFKLDPANEQGGTNAEFELNGIKTWRHSNTFTVNDFTFTLKDAIGSAPVTVSSKNDTDKVLDAIKGFVESYNELIGKISGKLKEARNRDYQPLTEDQKDALSEKEIEKWENLAKSGMIRNDPILSSVLSQMRIDFYSQVSKDTGNYKQLSSIGITTSANYFDGGKLEINEDKLREAIEKDPEAIYNLFGADGETYGEKGISRRLRDSLSSAIDKITARAGNELKTNDQFTIGKELDDIDDRISNFDRILKQKEDRYYQMYTAMEKAMQKANEQSAYLMQQLGSWS